MADDIADGKNLKSGAWALPKNIAVSDDPDFAFRALYDKVVQSYVLNVIKTAEKRIETITQNLSVLKPEGQAMFSVRKDVPKGGSPTQHHYGGDEVQFGEHHLPQEFVEEIQKAGGRIVEVIPSSETGAWTAVVERDFQNINEVDPVYRGVNPERATTYDAPGYGELKIGDQKTYIERGDTRQSDITKQRRAEATKNMDQGIWMETGRPYYDVSKRYDVDPTAHVNAGHIPPIRTTLDPGYIDGRLPATEGLLGQGMVPHYKTEAKAQEWREKLDTPVTHEILGAAFDAAKGDQNARNWFAMGQLQDDYINYLGEAEGRRKFQEDFAIGMAATTAGADPTSNLLTAAFGNFLRERGMPLPPSQMTSHPVGGRYLTGNIKTHRDMLPLDMRGLLEAWDTPKRFSFMSNFLGDLSRITIDEQMMKAFDPAVQALWKLGYRLVPVDGKPSIDQMMKPAPKGKPHPYESFRQDAMASPEVSEIDMGSAANNKKWRNLQRVWNSPSNIGTGAYGIVEQIVNDAVGKLSPGMAPANFQGVIWTGLKGTTGKPMMEHVNEAIERTAYVTGRTREEVLRDLITKNTPLYGMMGLLGTGVAANEMERN